MMRECLDDAGRSLQNEINKQLGLPTDTANTDSKVPEDSKLNAAEVPENKFSAATMALCDGNPEDDAMIAAFFAKQSAANKQRPTELPVKEWASNIIEHARTVNNSKGSTGPLDAGKNSAQSDRTEEHEMVDRLYEKFCSLQGSEF
jgi:hypothetical protein